MHKINNHFINNLYLTALGWRTKRTMVRSVVVVVALSRPCIFSHVASRCTTAERKGVNWLSKCCVPSPEKTFKKRIPTPKAYPDAFQITFKGNHDNLWWNRNICMTSKHCYGLSMHKWQGEFGISHNVKFFTNTKHTYLLPWKGHRNCWQQGLRMSERK